jgi:murein DD-endopeptidase MepM/ murein hydrolase activator NlpD
MAKKTAARKRRITSSDNRRTRARKKAPVSRSRRAQALRPSNQRIAPNVRRPTIPKTKLVPGPAIPLNLITARPPFQLPFKCGQTWRASTYDGHYPDQDSLDLLRFNGTTNVSANEDVLASAAGTVIEAHDTNTEDPPYGSVVTIEHNADWKTQYIHLDDALSVKKDDKVGRGQKIGTVGGNIAIFGTANAHLHYTQWFRSNGVRSVFDGVATAVHAGAKDANGNYPTENLVSANCPVAAAGIARAGNWANTYWISTSRSAFETKAQQLFDDNGLRLVWVSTFVENGKRRWAGIARAGNWASSFWVSTSRSAFETKAQQLFDDKGQRLIHVHTYVEGSTRVWMGIARSGDWSSSFWISNTRAAFETKAQDLFDNQGRRLTFVRTYVDGSTRRWIGIAQGGNWANSFWISDGFTAFSQKAQQLFDQQGRRLIHVHTYVEGNKRFWAGIARSGDWANSFWLSSNVDSFNFTAQDLFDDKGRRLVVVEFLSD